jgi:Carboxypeptidase regulatory-like domain
MRKQRFVGYGMIAVMLVALICGAHGAMGQGVTGEINGTVTDPSGAPVAGATVTARNVLTGVSYPTQTNSDGLYYLSQLPVGKFELKVEGKGFETAVRPAFDLVLNQVASVNVQMVVGAMSQTVEVVGTTPLLQTETTDISTHIDSVVTENIPLITRNYGQLTLLTPGAVSTNPGAFTSGQNTFQVGRPYVNGNREQTSNYILDGIDNNQNDNNEVAYSPSPDAIQELNLITQNPSAEFGNFLGGVLNTTIKSGTSEYHGSAFEFLRNDAFNANNWFNDATGTPKAALRFNQFGATAGGPIRKNKLFFFVDYEGQRTSNTSQLNAQVLSAAERAGNFGELCPMGFNAAGFCTAATTVAGSATNTQLFEPQAGVNPNNRVPIPFNNLTAAGLTLSKAASAIVNSALYPAANEPANVLRYTQTTSNDSDQGDVKIDWTPTEKDRVTGRYSQQSVRNPTTETFVLANNGITDNNYPLRNGVADWNHVISPTLINDLRLGLTYFPVNQGFSNPTGQNLPQMFGIPGTSSDFLPAITGQLGGVANIANNLSSANVFADTVIQAGDSMLKTYGNHEFHFGFQFNRYRDNFLYPGNEGLAGFFNFNGQYTANPSVLLTDATKPTPASTGSGLADFLLGFPNNEGLGADAGNRHVENSLYALYGQDSWKLRPNLTLNLGLRWELNTPREPNEGNAVNYSQYGGQLLTAQTGFGKALYEQYNGITNFQPRVGVAWQPGFLPNTVIRAGYGVSNFTESNGVNNLLTQNPPFETANNVTFPTVGATAALPVTTLDQGFVIPTGCTLALAQALSPACFAGVSIHAFDTRLRPEVHYQWNLGIQHQFGSATTVQVAYVGQENQHLTNIINLKQTELTANGTILPSPFLNPTLLGEVGQARYTESNGVSNYNALQIVLQERFRNGLQAQLNYTWSKCMSDTPGFFGQFGDNVATEAQTIAGWAFPQNPYNQLGDYGRCPQNIASLFNGYVVYELPFGRGRQFASNINRLEDLAIGGWRVSTSFVLHSGFAQTIFASSDTSGTGGFSTRANCVSGVPSTVPMEFNPANQGLSFLNPAAVTTPALGTFGNCAVGAFDGPAYTSGDLSIAKDFSITERQKLEFRADMTNFTNTPIFNFGQEFSGQHTAGASNYGEIFTSQGSRQIQFALKYSF